MMKTEFNLQAAPQDLIRQLVEWAKTLSPEEKAEVRAEMAKQFKPIREKP